MSPTPQTQAKESVSSADLEALADQLGRVPRGVVAIAARCVCGRPTVVRTAPRLDDGTPFPTSYYLTHPAAVKGCSTLEAEHLMETFNADLADDAELLVFNFVAQSGSDTETPDTKAEAEATEDSE